MAPAANATRTPRRGEPGFARHAREHGGDPRLPVEPAETPPASPTARQPASGRRGAATGRGRAPAERPGRARRTARAVARPERLAATPFRPGGGLTVNDASGFVLGLLAWVLALQFLDDPKTGVRNWLRAKFLNKGPGGAALP